MAELGKIGIYACALPMPGFDSPICKKWVDEIKRYAEGDLNDEIYLVGHSLGSAAILRYLENVVKGFVVSGAVLMSAPVEGTNHRNLDNFFEHPFDFESIKKTVRNFPSFTEITIQMCH